jgi:DNA mismatch repair protein MutS2
MDAKSQNVLELPKVLARLAGNASFSASKELALSLAPVTNLAEARRRQTETTEARLLLSLSSDLTVGGAHDVRPLAEAAERGSVLEAPDFMDIKSTLISARTMSRFFDKRQDQTPILFDVTRNLVPPDGLIDTISQVFDDHGDIRDGASEALARIRRELMTARDRLMSKLQRMVNNPAVASLLQETLITQREGRYVLPLRAEFKGRIKAVVHDQSASGATLFIEPLEVVDLNNQVRELELAERDEIRRILTNLSAQVGQERAAIGMTVYALAMLDLALAKARYADAIGASEPILHPTVTASNTKPGGQVRLIRARHPLLDPKTVVPIDLRLEDGVRGLVITGPNTGGKTVALKTAGLLSLMAQCGLHLPAESGSELPLFDGIFADIGDEQSIEQSLSTFSSHMTNLVSILKQAGPGSLAVLDELGAGTDPQEGAALARALLEAFLDTVGIVLVATHYPELKAHAHTSEKLRNASVEFDTESLRPTYHLTIGLPGRSNALAIASRLGLPEEVIDAARELISPQEAEAETLLNEIHQERERARSASEAAHKAGAEVEDLRSELVERLASIEDERLETLEGARQEAEAQVAEVRQELDRLRKQLIAAAQPLEALQTAEIELEGLEDEVAEPPARHAVPESKPEPALRLGDRVRVRSIAVEGVLVDLGETQAEVQVGRLRIRAQRDELSPAADPPQPEPAQRRSRKATQPGGGQPMPSAPPLELDLRGLTSDEALVELERRLDSAYLAGLPFVRVIHGKGTGKLREVIRGALKNNAYVRAFEPGGPSEGGDGVTVARLAAD